LLRGDYGRAAEEFLAEIGLAQPPAAVAAWAGLAVARQYGDEAAASSYREVPEVVAQVHEHLRHRLGDRASTPDQIARWLAG
jgi:hypothetical protein